MPDTGQVDGPAGADVLDGAPRAGGLFRGVLVAGAAAVLVGAVLISDPDGNEPIPARGLPTPAAVTDVAGPDLAGSCVGEVTLLSSAGAQVRLGIISPPVLSIAVGDRLSLLSTGPCGSSLWMSAQRDGVLDVEQGGNFAATSFRALRSGTVRVGVTHWACAELLTYDPHCRGLIALDGYVDVIVRPAA